MNIRISHVGKRYNFVILRRTRWDAVRNNSEFIFVSNDECRFLICLGWSSYTIATEMSLVRILSRPYGWFSQVDYPNTRFFKNSGGMVKSSPSTF